MIVDRTDGHLDTVKAFALETNQAEQLMGRLDYLDTYGNGDTRCTLFKDFAPQSFEFLLERQVDGEWRRMFNGGLIYHGQHDRGGDGGAPTFSVTLNPTKGWSIHT